LHQEVHKEKDKSWHDRHIKNNKFKEEDMVLLYEIKYLQQLKKFRIHWLWPYQIKFVTDADVVQLRDSKGKEVQGLVNGSRLKLYRDSRLTNPQ
jgi:hypothetical protein